MGFILHKNFTTIASVNFLGQGEIFSLTIPSESKSKTRTTHSPQLFRTSPTQKISLFKSEKIIILCAIRLNYFQLLKNNSYGKILTFDFQLCTSRSQQPLDQFSPN